MSPLMYISHQQEAYSNAYLRAVCAVAGCAIAVPETDHDKIDFTISSRISGTSKHKPKIDVQLKCRMGSLENNTDPISYALDIETYNSLRDDRVSDPRIILLLIAPEEPTSTWLTQSEHELAMKHCGYWLSLKGMPATPNTTSFTINIPRTNIFTPEKLNEMMLSVANGGDC